MSLIAANVLSYRGSFIIARLASVSPDRILAYAFLAVSYIPPNLDFDFEAALKATKAAFGYEVGGYQAFLADNEAAGIIEKNVSRRICQWLSIVY